MKYKKTKNVVHNDFKCKKKCCKPQWNNPLYLQHKSKSVHSGCKSDSASQLVVSNEMRQSFLVITVHHPGRSLHGFLALGVFGKWRHTERRGSEGVLVSGRLHAVVCSRWVSLLAKTSDTFLIFKKHKRKKKNVLAFLLGTFQTFKTSSLSPLISLRTLFWHLSFTSPCTRGTIQQVPWTGGGNSRFLTCLHWGNWKQFMLLCGHVRRPPLILHMEVLEPFPLS